MGTMKSAAHMLKCIISPPLLLPASSCISRTFVSATRPSEKKYVDKETAQTIKEAAQAVTEGIKETRQTGQFVKETITTDAGKVISSMAKKAFEVATDESDEKEEKGTWEKVKQVVEKVKGD